MLTIIYLRKSLYQQSIRYWNGTDAETFCSRLEWFFFFLCYFFFARLLLGVRKLGIRQKIKTGEIKKVLNFIWQWMLKNTSCYQWIYEDENKNKKTNGKKKKHELVLAKAGSRIWWRIVEKRRKNGNAKSNDACQTQSLYIRTKLNRIPFWWTMEGNAGISLCFIFIPLLLYFFCVCYVYSFSSKNRCEISIAEIGYGR